LARISIAVARIAHCNVDYEMVRAIGTWAVSRYIGFIARGVHATGTAMSAQ